MIPASATPRSASAISRSSGTSSRSTLSSVRSRSPGAARRTTIWPPASFGKSNACSGLPSAEHHVVRDVDDVRDRALPGRVQPRAQPHRRRRDRRRPRTAGRCSAGSRSKSSIADLHRRARDGDALGQRRPAGAARGRRARRSRARGRRPTAGRAGCRSTRRAAPRRRAAARRRAACPGSASSSSMIPPCSVPRPTSSSARIIPSETSPRTSRRSSFSPFGSTAPGQRDADGGADAEVPGAADDVARLALADVDLRHLQPVGVRVLLGLEHAADAEEVEVAARVVDAAALDALDLGGRDREPRRELLERHVDRRRSRAAS